jgi:hypothetical protein
LNSLIDIAGYLAMVRHTMQQRGVNAIDLERLILEIEADAGVGGLDVLLLKKQRGDTVFRDLSSGQFGVFARTEDLRSRIDAYLNSTTMELSAPTSRAIVVTDWQATTAGTVPAIDIRELEDAD